VLWADDPQVRDLPLSEGVERVLYGTAEDADLRAEQIEHEGFGSRFRVSDRRRELGTLNLRVPGPHNVANAMAAVGVGRVLGVSWEAMRSGLEGFQGVHRRFEVLGKAREVTVVSDYAHHPTEIEATLAAARGARDGRVLAAFQPHLYSRTRDFSHAFGRALSGADRVFVTDVYAAREEPIAGVSGRLVAESVPDPVSTCYVPEVADLGAALAAEAAPGDLVIVMGAGDVDRAGRDLLDLLEEGRSSGA
jgi:UDP-N-acetylmuramate--alanine ligase